MASRLRRLTDVLGFTTPEEPFDAPDLSVWQRVLALLALLVAGLGSGVLLVLINGGGSRCRASWWSVAASRRL